MKLIVYTPALFLATVETFPPAVGALVPVVVPLNLHHALAPKIGAEPLCAPLSFDAEIDPLASVVVTLPLASTDKISAVVAPLLPLASLIVPSG